nr:hypothetical protein [Tanacetum cinerariifolium]
TPVQLPHSESVVKADNSPIVNSKVMNFSHISDINKSSCGASAPDFKEKMVNGGSILDILDNLIRVGQFMGYDMEGSSKDIERIIEKMVNGGSILDILDNLIRVGQSMGYDMEGSSKDIERIIGLISRWSGDSIVFGDFNEVRCEEERFGSQFNHSTAREFNFFISSSGLVEINSEGYSFTWSHPSATKMSLISRWNGDSIVFGDFNEVRCEEERFAPLYHMSIYKAPKGVLDALESIRSRFFNGIDPLERKIIWVAWEKILASKKKGGLGVSSLFALNRALLLKWVWRFVSNDGSLWSQVINVIHGKFLGSHSVRGSSPWCSILREMLSLVGKGFDFMSHIKKHVGNGCMTKLWLDPWMSEKISNLSYFSCGFYMVTLLDTVSLSSSHDRWYCDFNGDGSFLVKDIREHIDDLFLRSSTDATRWVKCMPIKVNVFVWRARLDRIPTRCNLLNRGVEFESSLCPVCGLMPEDVNHILFKCDLAVSVFRRICHWWDIQYFDVNSLRNEMFGFLLFGCPRR